MLLLPLCASAEPTDEDNADAERQAREALEEGTDSLLDELELSDMEELYGRTELSESISFDELISGIAKSGLSQIAIEDALNAVLDSFKHALAGSLIYIGEMIVLLLITGLVKHLPGSGGEGASKAAFFTGYVICASVCASILVGSILTAKNALDSLGEVTNAVTPVLMVLLTGLGGLSTSAVMSPVMAALTDTVFTLVRGAVFPAIIACAFVNLLTNISSAIKLSKLSELIESAVKWFLGIVFTLFLGVCSLKGMTGAAVDGVYFKTAKYTIDKAVPFIGGMFSDTLDTLMSCGIIVKSAAGAAGLIILALVMLTPIITLTVNSFLYSAAGAIAEPFSDDMTVRMLTGMCRITRLMLAAVLTCTAMAFISIALLMGAADMGFMMR